MAKIINNLGYGTVGVEHSDERLAAVEEAKLTGQEFQSVGAKGNDYVDRETLRLEVEKVSNTNSEPFTKPVEDVMALNLKKARAHNEYSKDLMNRRAAEFKKLRTAENDDPEFEGELRNQQNLRIAREHTEKNIAFAEEHARNQDGVQEEVAKLVAEDTEDQDPITLLGKKSQVTDISESAMKEELQKKDRVIYGENSFKSEAVARRDVAPKNERVAADTKVTDDPNRIHEEVLDVKDEAKKARKAAEATVKTADLNASQDDDDNKRSNKSKSKKD